MPLLFGEKTSASFLTIKPCMTQYFYYIKDSYYLTWALVQAPKLEGTLQALLKLNVEGKGAHSDQPF